MFSNSYNLKIVLKIIYYKCVCSMNKLFFFLGLTEVVLCIKDILTLFFSPCTHSGQSVATKGSK